jgi:transposase
MIIGCDFHTRFQQIAMLDPETGEIVERRLEHEMGEARAFYAALPGPSRVGMEATGYSRWFERMLAAISHHRAKATWRQAKLEAKAVFARQGLITDPGWRGKRLYFLASRA